MITLKKGDCLELMKEIEDGSVDLLCTDPPYRQQIGGGGNIAHKYDYRKDKLQDLSEFEPKQFLEIVTPKMKVFNAFIWCSKDLLPDYINFAIEKKYNWNLLIWNKINPIPAYNNTLLPDTEYCIYIRETGAFFNNNLNYNDYRKVMSDRVANNFLGHPTQKHLWMINKLVKIGSEEGHLILDPFLGSGTTAEACHNLKRNCIGFEKEDDYFKIAETRINNLIKQQSLF